VFAEVSVTVPSVVASFFIVATAPAEEDDTDTILTQYPSGILQVVDVVKESITLFILLSLVVFIMCFLQS
jgi:hypothetical protein